MMIIVRRQNLVALSWVRKDKKRELTRKRRILIRKYYPTSRMRGASLVGGLMKACSKSHLVLMCRESIKWIADVCTLERHID